MKSVKTEALARAFVAAMLVGSFALAPASRAAAQQAASASATTTVAPAGVERVTSVEGLTEYRLANGMRVLLFPDPTKQTVTVNVTYLVGSAHENYGETGMAHLLEHLLFKGSKNHPNLAQEMTEHGARRNGSTWLDRTNYYETVAATDENLRWALEMEADRMVNSFVAEKDLKTEFSVVRNEMESGENDPFSVLLERAVSTAFLWHNYGNSTIGARSDVENVPIDRLQAFYRQYYQPDNAILIIAGKFDEAKTLGWVNSIFSAIPRPTRTLQKVYTVEPVQDGERSVTLRRVGDVQLVGAVYHVPSGSHEDFAAIDILSFILGDSPSGRLHKALVETKKASRVYGFNFQMREPAIALYGAEVRQGDSLDAARETFLQTVESVATNPPTKDEVERARQAILKNIELTLNKSDQVGLELSEWVAQGDWRLFFLHRDRIRKVTPEDVQRVANRYLKPSNRTLAQFIPTAQPDRAEIPAVPDVAAMLKDYKGDAAVALGEAFDPAPSNIESRTKRGGAAASPKLALLPKKTRGATVVASMTFRFGDEKSLQNRSIAGELVTDMLMRGTTTRSRQQIQDELDRLKARAFVSGGPTQAVLFVETVRENLPAVMRLMAEVLRQPSFPAAEFDQLKAEVLANFEQQRSDPGAIAQREMARHLNPYPKGDPRHVMTIDEEVEAVKATTIDDVKKFYADFYGASDAHGSFVGDFDDAEVARLNAELFGQWKSPRPYARLANVYREVPAINKSYETPDKANANFVAGLNLNVRDDDPDYPALVFGNYLLGANSASRLRQRIRDREGISYGVGSGLNASALDKWGTFTSFAIYAPENVARLEAAYKEELGRALSEGFTAEEVAKGKSGYLQNRQLNRSQDNNLAGALSSYLFINRTFQWDEEFERKVAALTPEQIMAAMRRHIDPSKITIIKAGDFAKKTAAAPKPAQ
ncbi:MAG TPA: pitrilysin family protein [Pyrinomonadaceae bacterium]|nr:pitrilysin family protein [Pyrinomonadaceae bacterium]